MKITSKITHQEILGAELKTSNNRSDYFYIDVAISIELEVEGVTHGAELQTGHDFYMGDYGLPSNLLSVYGEGLLSLLDDSNLSDQEDADDVNGRADTEHTLDQLLEIKEALRDVMIDAQSIVSEAEREAEAELESDETVYVVQDYIEELYDGRKEAFGPPALKCFDTEEEAESYIEENSNSYTISKEAAWERFKEQL